MGKAKKEPKAAAAVVVAPALTELQINFLNALIANLGIISKACAEVGITRQMHHYWMNGVNNPAAQSLYVERFKEIQEEVDDVVEDALLQKVLEGDVPCILHVSRTRLRKRGYAEVRDDSPGGNDPDKPQQFVLQVLAPTIVLNGNGAPIPLPVNGNGNGNGKH